MFSCRSRFATGTVAKATEENAESGQNGEGECEHEPTLIAWIEGPEQAASLRPQIAEFTDPRSIDYTHRG